MQTKIDRSPKEDVLSFLRSNASNFSYDDPHGCLPRFWQRILKRHRLIRLLFEYFGTCVFYLRRFFGHRSYAIISRIGLLLLFLLCFAGGISFVYSYYLVKSQEESLETAQNVMLKGYERTLRSSGETLASSLAEAVRSAKELHKDPQKVLQHVVNTVRYHDNGYYFIYDTNGINIAHPFFPEFIGENRIHIEDIKGKKYIKMLTEKALKGGGFVTYYFYKPGEDIPSPKLVYSRLIPGTNYWVGTGLYIDDIDKEKDRISNIFTGIQRRAILIVGSGVAALLVLVVIPVSLLMINSILKPWRQLEKELRHAQKMEAIGIFAGGIAHDFSNVLGAITSCTELALYDTPKDTPVYEDMLHVLKAAKRGKSLIKRIKEFSRQTDASRHSVNMPKVVDECMQLVQSILPATIDVRVHINVDNIRVKADPDQLLQVIMNLCTNAEQAMRGIQGILQVELDVVELDDTEARSKGLHPGTYARLSVTDNGTGMKPVVLKRIFEPFYTTRKKSGGTGLGLSMTQSIVKMHGGTIAVTSSLNKGSTFTVLLPCVNYVEEHEPQENLLEMPRGAESLLIVDDDPDVLSSLHNLFTRLGYNVESFGDSITALDVFMEDPYRFDLILTDQLMPQLTGTELSKKVKKVRPDLPVLLCSGFDGNGLLQRIPKDLKKVGISAFFRKPFDTVELCRTVRNLLDVEEAQEINS